MKLFAKWPKSARVLAALGVIVVAALGTWRTVNAAQDIAQAQAGAAINTTASPAGVGDGCSPAGCAACPALASCVYAVPAVTIEIPAENTVSE
jgi:hypothetical protein